MPVTACPSCDSANVSHRSTKTPTWRCRECAHEFEEPVVRQARSRHNGGPLGHVRTCGLCGTSTARLEAHLPECPGRDSIGVAAGGAD